MVDYLSSDNTSESKEPSKLNKKREKNPTQINIIVLQWV